MLKGYALMHQGEIDDVLESILELMLKDTLRSSFRNFANEHPSLVETAGENVCRTATKMLKRSKGVDFLGCLQIIREYLMTGHEPADWCDERAKLS